MKTVEQQTRRLMAAWDQATPTVPAVPSEEVVDLRIDLIIEETVKELLRALATGDLVKIFDGGIDSVVVIVGTLVAYGMPVEEGWEEVLRSNLAKIDPITGKVIKRADGKVLKPEGWTAPDLRSILIKHGATLPELVETDCN